ncbi:DnaB-like helicase C terminal domain-containing protein [Sulfitobacter marinus]|uniref:DnaB-like helicase C terminal domain-containing protein n=1 Tax=Sulfitobacter marinus TaxID=394264 RepID=A0A1I6QZ06_9RHOB|nr:DNA helicase [Sulfitobacter marinus]SFS57635.1 DnaB-like helicase C terminal domain-containing protein [Sulfitobacter marinus]
MRLSSPIYTLKREAKLLTRSTEIKLHQALDQIAKREGFQDWGHLASSYAKNTPSKAVLQQLDAGDMALIAARPGHGKTLLGLELVAMAEKSNRTGYFFTLSDTVLDIRNRLDKLGIDPDQFDQTVTIDTSDDICADHIISRIDNTAKPALILVDYLQLLDQKRSNPPLEVQIRKLKAFAVAQRASVILLSQIDRRFDLSVNGMPGMDDIRLPNNVDLSLFSKRCFLHDGKIQIEQTA